MILNETIEILEAEIRSLLLEDSALGIKEVMIGDLGRSAHSFPAIHIIKTVVGKSDIQVFSGAFVGLTIGYDITCLFTGSEGQQTIRNATTFVNNVYDVLQRESLNGRHFNNTCYDTDCTDISYGLVEFADVLIYGGVIKLEIDIIHTIGE